MKAMYERTSVECAPGQLEEGLRHAISAHAEANQLGNLLDDVVAGCETRSVRLYKNGLLSRLTGSGDPDTEHRTIALITRRYLVVAVTGAKRGTHVRSARLELISLSQGPAAAMSQGSAPGVDSGVSVTAQWSGETLGDMAAGTGASFWVGLGSDSVGRSFLDRLRGAVTEAKTS